MSGELFKLPLRRSETCVGTALDADGVDVFTVDVNGERSDDEVAAIVSMIIAAVNARSVSPVALATNPAVGFGDQGMAET